MKAINRFLNYFRYGASSKLVVAGVFTLALAGAITGGVITSRNETDAAGGRDCDTNAIVYCGAYGTTELLQKYTENTKGDIRTLYNAYGINASNIKSMVAGTAYKDGTIVVDGKVVARDSKSIGRLAKSYSHPKTIGGQTYHESSATDVFKSNSIGVLVLMKDGKFVGAILEACGNPITGTPPATPPPAPKPAADCSSLVVTPLSRTTFRLDATSATSNGATINAYKFRVLTASGATTAYKMISTGAKSASTTFAVTGTGSYTAQVIVNTSLGDRTNDKCKAPLTVTPAPAYECESLTAKSLSRTEYSFATKASARNGASVVNYSYNFGDGSKASTGATTKHSYKKAGSYTATVTVNVKVSGKTVTAPGNCTVKVAVPEEEKPAVEIIKKVNNKEHVTVGVNQVFTYQIKATNKGNVDLVKSVVTDKAPKGVTFIKSSVGEIKNNQWVYTIPSLKVGQSANFTITAKIPNYLGGTIKNTVCIESPQIPGNPDDCDDATVDVPKPGNVIVCNPATGETITVSEKDASKYKPVGDVACTDTTVCELSTKTIITIKEKDFDSTKHSRNVADCDQTEVPPVIPSTGPGEFITGTLGLSSLAGGSLYWLRSRRSVISSLLGQ